MARANRVIVVLKSQQTGRLASAASVRARATAQRAMRRPLIASVTHSGGAVTHQFTVLNAFAAQVSSAEKARLAASPSVAEVVPDALVSESQPDTVGQTVSGGNAGSGNPTTPQSGVCPSDPNKPLLEPEALGTMHVAYSDPNTPQAQNLATGKGVKVAFFADGLDINNPDSIRPDGSHVFIDYRDFTGEGPNAPTGAAEAFGDASSIAAQGRQVYDISDFVNPAHPLPPGCTITVRGVAPGASLIGMKVFGAVSSAYTSVIIQGMDWAVTQDHADIISESFGDHTMPDTSRDTIKQFNDAAVRAGVTVSQGTCDCGATGTPSSPATDPLVLDSGGNTNFQNYAQTTSYAFQFSNGTWLNDNISSIAGGGFAQNASSPDFVTPAEANWALCTPNPAIYEECTDFKGAPAQLEQFGGVSQSTPFTAGVAALMIEAYRNTHHGQSPSPALVKQILQSTSNDLGFPNEEQGSGEVDALKSVQEAMSVNGGTPTGHGLLFNQAKLTITKTAGSSDDENVSVTNTGATTQTVSAHGRALTRTVSDDKQDVILPPPGSPSSFVDQFGGSRPFVTTTFTVPANVDRLVAYDAWPGPNARVGLTLIDPNGTYAAYTRPQGDGNHTQVDVRKPVAGKWTALVFLRDGTYTGVVHLEFATERFGGVDSVSPSSLTLRPGQTGRFRLHTRLPSSPGDSRHDLVISDSSGDQKVVPVVLRSLVPVGRHGGAFSGTIIGGNGREFIEQQNTFAFDVPRGSQVLSASLTFPDNPNTELIGTLVDPDGNLLGSQSTLYVPPDPKQPATYTHGLRAVTLDPKPGRWTFVVNVANPVGGQTLSSPYRGAISFNPPRISVRGLPSGDKVKPGQPFTATVTVHNDGPGIEDVFADPRLNSSETDSVFPLSNPTVSLPTTAVPAFLVPTQVDQLLGVAQANRPILLELGFGVIGEGDPDLLGTSQGNNAAAFYGANEVANGPWFEAPAMRGPFDTAQTGTASMGLLAHLQAFDRNANSSTGDIWRQTVDADAPDYTPLSLAPGQSGRITVTFTPQGDRGSKVKGTLYVDDFGIARFTGNEQAAFPYSYKVK